MRKKALFVVAHPDDEALFFGGTAINLYQDQTEIHIAVLTDAKFCNSPKTAEQWEREPARIACRWGAFARACLSVRAFAYRAKLPQAAESDSALIEKQARAWLTNLFRAVCPTHIFTHGPEGDYTADKYISGWEVARAQHKLCHDLVRQLSQIPFHAIDPNGDIIFRIDRAKKVDLLRFYRYGCTQTKTWDAEKDYSEWCTDVERFTLIR